MAKFIKLFICFVLLYCLNNYSALAQSHPNVETKVFYDGGYLPVYVYDGDNKLLTNGSSFSIEKGIKSVEVSGYFIASYCPSGYSGSCYYKYYDSFSSTPYGYQVHTINSTPPASGCYCVPASANFGFLAHRINNTLTCPSLVAFDNDVIFTSHSVVNFDASLREYLHIEVYDNVYCTGTALASFNLAEGVSKFNITQLPGQVDKSVYQSLTNKLSYLKVTYLSSTVPYTSSDFVVCPIFFVDRVDLSRSTFSSNPVSCHGGTDGGVKIDQIILKSGRPTTIKDTLRFTIKKLIAGNWISMLSTDYSTFYNSTNYIAPAISPLPAGTYRLKVWGNLISADSIGNLLIDEPSILSYSLSPTQPICLADKGSVTVTPSGGNGGYTVTVNGTSQTSGFSYTNLSQSTTYSVLVKDSKLCEASSPSVVIGTGWDPTITTNPTKPACSQNKNGSITFNVNGTLQGTSQTGYTYFLNNEPTAYPFTGLSPGTYSVKLTDNRGCPSVPISDVVLGYDTSNDPVVSLGTIVQPKCLERPGSIEVLTSKGHGTSTYTYKCSGKSNVPGQGSSYAFSGLLATSFTLSVIDAMGCPSNNISTTLGYTNTLTISGSPDVQQSVGSTDYHLTCNGGTNGSIGISASSIPSSISSCQLYDKNNIEITGKYDGSANKFNPLSAGIYTIKITDADNCTQTSVPISLIAPSKVTITSSQVASTEVTCHGGTDGSITIANVIGGIGSYEYSFDNGTNFNGNVGDNIKSDCSAITYHLKARDSKGCVSDPVDKSVTEPPLLTVTPTPIPYKGGRHVSCHNSTDGRIQATISGGTPNYSAYLFRQNDTPAVDYSNALDSKTGLTSSSPAPIFSGLPLGNYKVVVVDVNGCSAIQTVNLNDEPASLGISNVLTKYKSGSDYHISCNGYTDGEIEVTIAGGTLPYTVYLKKTTETNPIQKTITSGSSLVFGDNLLGAGEYQLRVVDDNGCQYPANGLYESTKYSLIEPLPITVSLPLPEHNGYYIKCYGDVIPLTPSLVSGGNGTYDENNYSYTWSNGQSTKTASGLGKGAVTLTVSDNKHCPSATASVTLNQPEPLYFKAAQVTKPKCAYSSDGQIEINATGGVSSYIFNIGADIQYTTPAMFDTLTDGAYTIYLEDYNGCTHDTIINVENYPALSLSITDKSIPHCYGGTDGWLQIAGFQGNPINGSNYKFRLFNNGNQIDSIVGTTALFDTLVSGTYTVTIMDGFGCNETITPTIDPAVQIKYTISSVPNQCFNDNTANLKIKATSGYGNFMFAYCFGTDTLGYTSKPDSTLILSNLNWNQYNTSSPLPYRIYIRDANYTPGQPACLVHDMVTLPMVEKMVPLVQVSSISCLGANNGSMTVSQVENSQGSVSYSWLGPKDGIESVTSNAISGLTPGIYTVTVKDSHSCEFSESRSFSSPQPMSVTVMNTIPESGSSMNDGKAFFEVTGARDTISYWIDGGLTQTAILDNSSFKVEPLIVGSHTITVANPANINCKVFSSFTIKHQPPSLALLGKRNATFDGADGMISVVASGGSGIYTYIWLNQAGDTLKQYTASMLATLSKGLYSVVAMDSEGNLSNVVTNTIIESDELSIALMNQIAPTCRFSANGAVKTSAGGGYRPYTYWWTNANGATVSSDSLANSLLPGNYTAFVKDNRGAQVSIMVPVVAKDSIKDINLLAAQPTCHNQTSGQIQISSIQGGSGNFSYQWSTGATSKDLDNVASGLYTVTVFDNAAQGKICAFTKSKVISSGPVALALLTDSVISPVCHGGADGKIYVSALGGTSPYSIAWPGTAVNGSAYYNAAAGKHAVKVTDNHGCQTTDTVLVENSLPIMFDQTLTQPKCVGDHNGSISLTMLNGRPNYSAKWTPELYTNNLQVTVPAGSYTAEITDANGCKANGSFTILSPKPLKVDSFLVISPGCINTADGSLTAKVSGGNAPYIYKWNNYQKGQTATALIGGNYSVTISDNNFCQTSAQVELTTPAPVTFNINVKEPSCSGYADGSLLIAPQGGTGAYSCSVNLQPSELVIPNLYAGRYNIVVKDANNCVAAKTAWVSEPTPMVAAESILSMITCANLCNGQVRIDVSGSFAPYSAVWDGSGTGLERNDLCAGTFQVKISDSHGCQISRFITMEQPDPIKVGNMVVVNPACAGGSDGSAEIICSGGTQPYAISWNNGQTGNAAKGLSAAAYVAIISDANNCSVTQNIEVEDPAKETIPAFPSEFKLCDGQQNIIDPGSWASYAWYLSNTKVSDTNRFNANQTGSYKLSVISEKGCKDSTTFSVQVSKDLLLAKFLIPNDVITNDTVEIVDVSWPVPDSISWHIDSENAQVIKQLTDRQQIVFKNAGEYSIRLVAHKALCVSENEQTITVYNSTGEKVDGKQPIKPPSDIEELYLYPNPSSGSFTVKIKLSGISKVSLKIVKMADNTLIAVKESENSDLYELPFDLPGVTPGVYLLSVITDTSQKYVKFVVMN